MQSGANRMGNRVVFLTLAALGFGALLLVEQRYGTRGSAPVAPTMKAAAITSDTSDASPAPGEVTQNGTPTKPGKQTPPANLLLAEKRKFPPPHPTDEPEFARFAAWVEEYLSAD